MVLQNEPSYLSCAVMILTIFMLSITVDTIVSARIRNISDSKMQELACVGRFSLAWPKSVMNGLNWLGLSTFDLEMLPWT